MQSNEKVKSHKFLNFMLKLFSIIAIAVSIFAIYEIYLLDSIENLIRYIVMGILGLIDIVILIKLKGKRKKKKTYLSFLIIYSLICAIVGIVISYFYGQISSINKEQITYTSDLLVMNSNKANSIDDINDMKIGILKDKKSPEGYIIPREIIKEKKLEDENQIVEYEDYTSMLVDMYANELDGLFVAVGRIPENQNFASLIDLDENGYVIAKEDCHTNYPGIFVAGDNRTKELRQLVTATSDGAMAATEAVKYLNTL